MMRGLIVISLFVLSWSCTPKTTASVIEQTESQKKIVYLQESEVQLAPANMMIDSLLFRQSATVDLSFDMDGATIMYAIGPEKMQEYQKPLSINNSQLLQAKVQKEGYIDSETSQIQLIKVDDLTSKASITVTPLANDAYPGSGASSLIDLQKGTLSFRDGNKWLGFQDKIVEVDIEFPELTKVRKLYVSLLSDAGAWIFKPQSITVLVDGVAEPTFALSSTKESEKASLYMAPIHFAEAKKCKTIKLIIKSMNEIPAWHQGKGTKPWLFIDEIIVQ